MPKDVSITNQWGVAVNPVYRILVNQLFLINEIIFKAFHYCVTGQHVLFGRVGAEPCQNLSMPL